ncbi:MAG TPA: hypothetical protein VGK67_39195 [Myxococcales bacterium]|jgi:hypothetical protein
MPRPSLRFPLFLLTAALGCATPGPATERSRDEIVRFEALVDFAATLPARVQRSTLRVRAGATGEQLIEDLARSAGDCRSMAEDLTDQSRRLMDKYPGHPQAKLLDLRAAVIAVQIRDAAAEADAAAKAVTELAAASPEPGLPGSSGAASLPAAPEPRGSSSSTAEVPPSAAAPVPAARAEPPDSAVSDPDLVRLGARDAAAAIAVKLKPLKSRPVVVTPAIVDFGSAMPKVALAFGMRGGEADVHGRAFARHLASELARAGFKAVFSSDVGGQLAAAPLQPLPDPSGVRILVYGAVAVDRGQWLAWDLRAVDLNNDGIVAESQGAYRSH